jgi:type VI protein secretion system component VasK
MAMIDSESRNWPLLRIISASLLVLVVLALIGYGIYSVVNNNSSNKVATNALPKTPAGISQQQNNSATNPNSNQAGGAPTSGSSATTMPSSPSQLTNTGPGNSVIIGFSLAFAGGTALHYVWRRQKQLKATR